jgi:hypothetical protein
MTSINKTLGLFILLVVITSLLTSGIWLTAYFVEVKPSCKGEKDPVKMVLVDFNARVRGYIFD